MSSHPPSAGSGSRPTPVRHASVPTSLRDEILSETEDEARDSGLRRHTSASASSGAVPETTRSFLAGVPWRAALSPQEVRTRDLLALLGSS